MLFELNELGELMLNFNRLFEYNIEYVIRRVLCVRIVRLLYESHKPILHLKVIVTLSNCTYKTSNIYGESCFRLFDY